MKLIKLKTARRINGKPGILTLTLVASLLTVITGFITLNVADAEAAASGKIAHIPPVKAQEGVNLTLEGRIEGGRSYPVQAVVFFRTEDKTAFKMSELELDGWNFSGEIDGADMRYPSIEYYLEVEFADGSKLTDPEGAPRAVAPYKLNVAPAAARKSAQQTSIKPGTQVTILSPDPGGRIPNEDVLIAVSILKSEWELKPEGIRIELNNVDVTGRAFISPEIISLVLPRLRPGLHQVSIYDVSSGTKVQIINWGFFALAPEKISAVEKKRVLPVKGQFAVQLRHENISSKERDIASFDGKLNGAVGALKWMGSAHVTSLENKNLQPQNRFLAALNYKKLTVKGGDTQPRFSQFTMWGVRNRGVEMIFHSHNFSLDVATGSMYKAIEGKSIAGLDTVVVKDSTGVPIPSLANPGSDSTRIDTVFTIIPGTFRRSMLAIRPGFPLSDNVTLSLNILKAKDQVSSIEYGQAPKDNLVFGADIDIHSRNRRFSLTSESAISMYNSDITDGPMSDAEALEKLIVVNQYFEPLPTDSTILESGIKQGDLGLKVINELLASSLANQTSLTLNLFHNELKVGYRSVGRSFRSFGSPAVQTDIMGYSVDDRLRLFGNRVYLSIGYENSEDNVNGRAETTLNRSSLSGGLAIYTPPNLPNLSFNTKGYNRENDAVIEYLTLPDGTIDSTGNPVEDQTKSMDLSIDQSFVLGGFEHSVALSFNQSKSSDVINLDAESDLSNTVLRLSSRKGKRLETSLALSLSEQNSLRKMNKVDYNIVAVRAKYMLLQDMLWLSGGINSTAASGGLTPDLPSSPTASDTVRIGNTLDFSRIEFSLGVDLNIGKHHKLGINAFTVNHVDDGFIELFSWNNGSWSSTSTRNDELPNYINQDDLMARLRYTFTF